MTKVTNCLSGAALSLMLVSSAAFGQATIEVGSVEGSGTIEVILRTGGNDVAGTENTIEFGPEVQITGCTVNPDINRTASAFSLSPSGCSGDCEQVKALILSFTDLNPLPDGAVLYTCEVDAGSAAAGTYPLLCSGPGGSDPAGNSVDTNCTDGEVFVADTPKAQFVVGNVTGVPGGTVQVDVTLNLLEDGASVAGTENVLGFSPEAQIVGCTFNPDIDRSASAVSFQPSGCTPGTDCESLKALVLSFTNLEPLPDDVVLYTCDVALAGGTSAATISGATGTFPITCSEPGGSDPDGNPVTMECVDGSVTIEAPPTPVPTATATQTSEPEATATDTPDDVPPTETPVPPTNTPAPQPDDDSCAIVAPQSSSTGWMLLMPMAALLWLRRRNR